MPRPVRVLLVEDVDDDAELVLRELRRGDFAPEHERVDTGPALIAALARPWDLVISDYRMPELDGLAVLRLVQHSGHDAPVILVSGTIAEDEAVLAMKAGAADYLLKGHLKRLVPAVERELREAADRAARRRAEEARSRSDERARMVARATNDLLWDWDLASGAVWVSEAASRSYGWHIDGAVTIAWWLERLHPDDKSRVREGVHRAIHGGQAVWTDEYRFGRADGSFATVYDRRYLVRGADGAPERLIGSMMDMSERVHLAETLRASEERFRTLVSSLDDVVFTLDRDQRVDGVFGRWLERAGRSAADFIGKRPVELAGADAAAVHEPAFARALAGAHASYEVTLGGPGGLRPPGGEAERSPLIVPSHFLVALSPLHDAAGRVIGVVGLGRDVTEQKRVQEQLLLSDRMVSVGTLAAGVAHEINNPLAAVVANLDFANRELLELRAADASARELPPAQRHLALLARLTAIDEPLREARAAADRVRQIVRDLKVFSRSEPNEDRRGPVDVERVLESSLRMAWNEIRHRARVVRDLTPVPPVEANESRLGQVFLNLLVNAAQAIREGNADHNQIRVATRLEDDRVVIELHDTGAGMPPEVQRKLFTPFFTTKPVGTGTGLGLSICHRIVTSLGGAITVESQVGRGSTFRVYLPVARLELAEESPPPPVPRPGKRGRVLVIDDEPFMANALGRTLARDHEVLVLGQAQEALARIVAGDRFDVILCDLMMPHMTGMDLHAELARAVPEQAERMIFMTGGAFTPTARAFLDSTPNQRIEKPFDALQLAGMIQDRLR